MPTEPRPEFGCVRPLPTITVLGVPLLAAEPEEAVAETIRLAVSRPPTTVFFANAHTLNLAHADPSYHRVLRSADLVLNDGFGVALAARMTGGRFPANLNGSDLTPRLLGAVAELGWSVYLLGARPGVADEAADRLRQVIPKLDISGQHHGYLAGADGERLADQIRDTQADVVVVGMGNPIQERWLHTWLPRTGARLGTGVGAFLDFAAGRVPRAPAWATAAGVEWVHRLAIEPRRMWRRYVFGNPAFLMRVVRERCDHPLRASTNA